MNATEVMLESTDERTSIHASASEPHWLVPIGRLEMPADTNMLRIVPALTPKAAPTLASESPD